MVILLILIAASIVFSILMVVDYFINIAFSIISIFVVSFTLIILTFVLVTHLSIPQNKTKFDTVYKNLVQRQEIGSSTDTNLYNDITEFNTAYETYKSNSESIWGSCLYPNKVIEDVNAINYEIADPTLEDIEIGCVK